MNIELTTDITTLAHALVRAQNRESYEAAGFCTAVRLVLGKDILAQVQRAADYHSCKGPFTLWTIPPDNFCSVRPRRHPLTGVWQ